MRFRSLALLATLLPAVAAHADTFSIAVTVNGTTGNGTLTGNSNGQGAYLITAATGLFGSGPIALLAPNDPNFMNDNLFYASGARLFDVEGIGFSGSFGMVNLFSTVSGYEAQGFDTMGNYFDVPASVSLTSAAATPEPSSVLLSFTGMLAVGALCMRKRFAFFGV